MSLALLIGACMPSSTSRRGTETPGPGQLSEADAGKTVELRPGKQLNIVLNGNPTTGYQWELASVNELVLKSLGQPTYKASSQALGAGGMFEFMFQAAASGKSDLQLVYRRPFEKDTAPLKTYQVSVVVR